MVREEKIATFWQDHLSEIFVPFTSITEADNAISRAESELNSIFPNTFKTLYRLRNGGYTLFDTYRPLIPVELLSPNTTKEGTGIIFGYGGHWDTLESISASQEAGGRMAWLVLEDSETEPVHLNATRITALPHLSRLVIFAHFGGDNFIALDYGYTEDEQYPEPQVVYFEENDLAHPKGFHEVFRVQSFDEFFDCLTSSTSNTK